jgi:hypothetical protein
LAGKGTTRFFHIIFAYKPLTLLYLQNIESVYHIPLGFISRVKECKKNPNEVEITSKSGEGWTIVSSNKYFLKEAIGIINKYAFPSSIHQLFAFVHQAVVGAKANLFRFDLEEGKTLNPKRNHIFSTTLVLIDFLLAFGYN